MRFPALLVLLCACTPAPPLDWSAATAIGAAPDAVDPTESEVVFLAIGDFGKHTDAQARTAAAIATACEAAGCQFTVMLGDNLYDTGLDGSEEKEADLRDLVDSYPDIPAWMVLGNHDWHHLSPELERVQRELNWIDEQDDVFGAFHFYDFAAGPTHFWAADTNWIVRHEEAAASVELEDWSAGIGDTVAPWVFVMGHHPLLSNGDHGNAGLYKDSGLDLWPGEVLADWYGEHVIGVSDLFLAGHDHSLNFFPDAGDAAGGDMATLVSGAAAKCRPARPRDLNPGQSGATATFEHYGAGFAIVRATETELEVTIHADDKDAWTVRRTIDDPAWTGDAPQVDREDRCD